MHAVYDLRSEKIFKTENACRTTAFSHTVAGPSRFFNTLGYISSSSWSIYG